ncbi:MAG: hypothetical protein LBN03_01675 [Bifidobacteriaceae bacterium]|jgi:DNA polymerase III alpha subunit (gram-positive type)|nr:hypothetical protein [Bifidobacteriaceae bacterium]
MNTNKLLSIEIQTTGLDFEKDNIIQICAVKREEKLSANLLDINLFGMVPNIEEYQTNEWYLLASVKINEDAKNINKLNDNVIRYFGKNSVDSLINFQKYLTENIKNNFILVAYNAIFDLGYINYSLSKLTKYDLRGIKQNILDVYLLDKILDSISQKSTFNNVKNKYKVNSVNSSDGMYKAFDCITVLLRMTKKFPTFFKYSIQKLFDLQLSMYYEISKKRVYNLYRPIWPGF